MDKDGECYPTQRQIAEITGLSLTTVNKSVANLLEIKINGKHILERTLRGSGQRKNSVYTIFDIAPEDIPTEDFRDIDAIEEADVIVTDEIPEVTQETAEDGSEEVVEVSERVIKNSKDIAHYFSDKYKTIYGKSYVINYKRDLGLIKNKLVKNFEIDEIVDIIDVALEEYSERWSNSKYPTPTIGMLCSWLCNEVVKVIISKNKEEQKAQELIDDTLDYIEEDYSDFMDFI